MFDLFKEWLEAVIDADLYTYARGEWTETEGVTFICSIYPMGGSAIDVDDRRPRYRVLLVGPRQSKQSATTLLDDMERIIQAALTQEPPCGAASIRVITEPSGPGYTTENRAWVSVDFQITY